MGLCRIPWTDCVLAEAERCVSLKPSAQICEPLLKHESKLRPGIAPKLVSVIVYRVLQSRLHIAVVGCGPHETERPRQIRCAERAKARGPRGGIDNLLSSVLGMHMQISIFWVEDLERSP